MRFIFLALANEWGKKPVLPKPIWYVISTLAFAVARTPNEAFAIYENTRKERANRVQLASRQQADEIQGVTKRGANPGVNAYDRGLYLYNPVTVPLALPA